MRQVKRYSLLFLCHLPIRLRKKKIPFMIIIRYIDSPLHFKLYFCLLFFCLSC